MSASVPDFRRATKEDALDLAQRMFAAEERVDMLALAEHLGIGRTTLYRWVGDRERLMGRVVVGTIAEAWAQSRSDAVGSGVERTLDAARRFMEAVTRDDALRGFVQREPSLGLRVLMDPDGLVASAMRAELTAALVESGPPTPATEDAISVTVQAATALVWANVAGGLEPQVDAIVGVMRLAITR